MSLFAISAEPPQDMAPLEKRLGGRVEMLSDAGGSALEAMGLRDPDGAPWYDRIFMGARAGAIAYPATVIVGRDGRITFLHRAKRTDDRPTVEEILEGASSTRRS